MKTPVFNLNGENASREILVLGAQEYLPQHLLNQIGVSHNEVRRILKESLLIAFLAAPLLSALCAFIAPFAVQTVVELAAPVFLHDLLLVIDSANFGRAFGLTMFPITFLIVLWGSAQRSASQRLKRENDALILELAFQKGHDQSLIRDSSGGFKTLI
jgi:uncharacterized membrane protein